MNKNQGVSFVSTSQGGRRNDLERLILSVRDFENCEFIFVDQDSSFNNFVPFLFFERKISFIHIRSDEKISLSRARNLAIERATKKFIVFSDDDAKYEKTFNFDVQKLFNSSKEDRVYIVPVLEMETGLSYGSRKYPKAEKNLTIHEIMHLGLSLSILIKRESVQKLGGFDENLGVGTGIGCGEESDFLLRCLIAKIRIVYSPSISIFHPAFDNSNHKNLFKVRNYARGYGYVCTKNYVSLKLQFFLRIHYLNLIGRTFAGIILSPNRKIYYYRLLGLVEGGRNFFRVSKDK